jgi:3-phenylpropionate/cinnamic acid dioxygenase small subunit
MSDHDAETTENRMSGERTDNPVDDRIYVEIQRFLSREAALLDRRQYRDWHALVTEDIRYRVSAQVSRDVQAGMLDYAIIDEDPTGLRARVEQIANPKLTHAENPASLTRRFISSIEASTGNKAGEFLVSSSILVYRNRTSLPEEGFYCGERRDVLRKVDGTLRLASRDVRLDQVLVRGPVSTLF